MIEEQIRQHIIKALRELGYPEDLEFTLEHPGDMGHGDFASNVALVLSKQLGKNPRDIAQTFIDHWKLEIRNWKFLDSVQVAGPGFLNFTLSQEYFLTQLRKAASQDKVNTGKLGGKKITVEFTDPNPFKEFHIGHLYSNIVGESVSRLLEAQGAEVRRVCYQGDVGLHVAKSLWGLRQKLTMDNAQLTVNEWLKDLGGKPLEDRIKLLGQAYAMGATAYEENEEAKEAIKKINKQVFEKDSEIMPLYQTGRQWSLDYFETIYARLGTKFEGYYFESIVGEVGKKLVEEYLEKGVFEKSQGAIIFPGEKYGLHSRVFINSLGLPTYEAKELGLAPTKYADEPYDFSIIVTGNEINEYFKVLLVALQQINPDLAKKTKHLSHGMVRLPEGKMSSRTGNVVTGEWLLNTATKKAEEKMKESHVDIDAHKSASQLVGDGAVKYALLKTTLGRDVEFSFDESVSFDGNSGPYLQYTYVRTQSVLCKAKEISNFLDPAKQGKFQISNSQLSVEESTLLRLVSRFDETVIAAANNYNPSILCNYIYNLAQSYNLFYQKHKVLGSEQEEFRLSLTSGVGNVIKSGLDLLGIQAPEKM